MTTGGVLGTLCPPGGTMMGPMGPRLGVLAGELWLVAGDETGDDSLLIEDPGEGEKKKKRGEKGRKLGRETALPIWRGERGGQEGWMSPGDPPVAAPMLWW